MGQIQWNSISNFDMVRKYLLNVFEQSLVLFFFSLSISQENMMM